MEFRIDPKKTAISLLVIAILLTMAHIAGMISRYVLGHRELLGLIDTFNLNYENNVPTFFSAILLVICAVLLAVIAGNSASSDRDARYWKWLAIIFAFLAVDEDASLHELLIDPFSEILPATGPLYFAWVVPYGIIVLLIGLLYFRFVLSLPRQTRRLIIAAGCIYLTGALGCELAEGWYLTHHDETEDFLYSFLIATEESFEMFGIILFIYALLVYLRQQLDGRSVSISISRF